MRKWITAILVSLMVVILVSSCTSQSVTTSTSVAPTTTTSSTAKPSTTASTTTTTTTASQIQTGGTFKILITRPANRFGYPPTIVGPDRDYSPPFFNRLVSIGDDGKLKPELALSWDASPDGKTITLKLRQGVKFHDGSDFNAAAVKTNIGWLIAPNPIILSGITSVDVVDDYTVKINLTDYNNLLLYQLSTNFACYIYSPTAFAANNADWAATHPVGTGPFMLKDYQANTSMTYVKNPNYWEKGLPYLDGMVINTVADPMTQIVSFKAGQANGIYDCVPTNAAQLRDSGYPLQIAPGSLIAITFDAKGSEIFANQKVRQAIEYAIDKESITNGPGLGLYKTSYQIVNSASPDYNPACPPRKYDVATAKKLLAEAGYPNGFSFKGFFQDTTWKDGVVAVQGYLDKVGIKMEVNYVNAAAYASIRAQGKIEKGAAAAGVLEAVSNNLFMMDYYFRSDSAVFQYISRPAGSDALIAQAKASKDPAETTKINQQISKLMYDDATIVPLWFTPRIVVLDKSVQDSGWFIAGDSSNNKFGTATWLKK
jgi:peptide/nickel transport system substrate-binding protein